MVQTDFYTYTPTSLLSNGQSTLSSSQLSILPQQSYRASPNYSTGDDNSPETSPEEHAMPPPSSSHTGTTPPPEPHIVHLSAIEHCMPRAYIRVCLAYRLPVDKPLSTVIEGLNRYARKLVDAKPYLAGYVVPAPDSRTRVGLSEIQFTDDDFLTFPSVEVRHLASEEIPFSYKDLDTMALPPSVIRPELVSALPEGTDDGLAPAFRMQANIVDGGLIVSVYLHHCIADGIGLSFLLTGAVLRDGSAFDRHLEANDLPTPSLNKQLSAFARKNTDVRQKLSWSDPNQMSDREIKYRTTSAPSPGAKSSLPGRGCIVAFSRDKLEHLELSLKAASPGCFMTANDALQALLWHHMTKARLPSIRDPAITKSKLLIPVNIRKKLKEPISESYLGAAVDFAAAELSMSALSSGADNPSALAGTALIIRRAIEDVDEAYIRQAIALSLVRDPNIDVRDLMASNMNRTEGADMYITSWERLGLYDATLGMGLGRPDWVRKPWSKDPGSCVIMPSDDRKPYIEVLVQMTECDMERLLADEVFISYVIRTID